MKSVQAYDISQNIFIQYLYDMLRQIFNQLVNDFVVATTVIRDHPGVEQDEVRTGCCLKTETLVTGTLVHALLLHIYVHIYKIALIYIYILYHTYIYDHTRMLKVNDKLIIDGNNERSGLL